MLLLHLYIKKVAKKGWLSRWDAAGYMYLTPNTHTHAPYRGTSLNKKTHPLRTLPYRTLP